MQRFENQLREAREETRREFEDFSDNIDHTDGIVHRVSRAITPASPIPEEEGNDSMDGREEERERSKSNEIFVTQSERKDSDSDRTDC